MTEHPRCRMCQPVHTNDQKPGLSPVYQCAYDNQGHIKIWAHCILYLSLVFYNQDGINQCGHVGSIFVGRLLVHEKITVANPELEKTTENSERRFLKRNVFRSDFSDPLSTQFSHSCQNKTNNWKLWSRAMTNLVITLTWNSHQNTSPNASVKQISKLLSLNRHFPPM